MAHDPKAFEILVRQHHRRLLAYGISILRDEEAAKDVVQEAFVTAYRTLERFDASRDFGAWIRGIVRNKCREWARERRMLVLDETAISLLEARHRDWDECEASSSESLFAALARCLGKLPDLLARTVRLFYLERLPGARVAALLSSDEAAVRKRLQRARLQLGHCIEQTLHSSDLRTS